MNKTIKECEDLVAKIIQKKRFVSYSNFKTEKSKLQRMLEIESLQKRLDRKLTDSVRKHLKQQHKLEEIYKNAVLDMAKKPGFKSGYYPFKSPLTLDQIIWFNNSIHQSQITSTSQSIILFGRCAVLTSYKSR